MCVITAAVTAPGALEHWRICRDWWYFHTRNNLPGILRSTVIPRSLGETNKSDASKYVWLALRVWVGRA